jgi:hypothetical protein
MQLLDGGRLWATPSGCAGGGRESSPDTLFDRQANDRPPTANSDIQKINSASSARQSDKKTNPKK